MPIGIVVPVVLFVGILLGWGGYKACSWLFQRTSVEELERLTCIDTFTLCNPERGGMDIEGLFDRVIARGKRVTCIYVSRFRDGYHIETVEVIALKTLARVKIVFYNGTPQTLGAKLGPMLPYNETIWYGYGSAEEGMLVHIFHIVQNEARYEIPKVAHYM